MKHEVLLLRKAATDFDTIVGFLQPHSPASAARWCEAFEKALAHLEKNPQQFALAPENDEFPFTIRQISFKTKRGRTYRVVYTIVGHQVRVLRVLGPAHDLLKEDDL